MVQKNQLESKGAKSDLGLKYVVKYEHGARWLLLYQQNIYKGLFANLNPLLNIESGRFSMLNLLTEDKKINGSFEFLYEAPYDKQYLRWRQDKNPLDIDETTDTIDGFYLFPESTMSTSIQSKCHFNGLARSNSGYALLDGCRYNINWNWAVIVSKLDPDGNMLPTTIWTTEITLWLRITDSPGPSKNLQIIRKFIFATVLAMQ